MPATDGLLGLGEIFLEGGLPAVTLDLVGQSLLRARNGLFPPPGQRLFGHPELAADVGDAPRLRQHRQDRVSFLGRSEV